MSNTRQINKSIVIQEWKFNKGEIECWKLNENSVIEGHGASIEKEIGSFKQQFHLFAKENLFY